MWKIVLIWRKLGKKIQKLIKNFKNEVNQKDSEENESGDDKTSPINLVKEKYISTYYYFNEFPFYKYFYYTDYPNVYIFVKLKFIDKSQYPLLKLYLEDKINEKDIN